MLLNRRIDYVIGFEIIMDTLFAAYMVYSTPITPINLIKSLKITLKIYHIIRCLYGSFYTDYADKFDKIFEDYVKIYLVIRPDYLGIIVFLVG